MIDQPIFPAYGRGQVATVTAAPATMSVSQGHKQLCLTNAGTQMVYVRVSDVADTTVVSTADYPCPPNTQLVISKGLVTALQYYAPGGAGSTLHVIPCEGF